MRLSARARGFKSHTLRFYHIYLAVCPGYTLLFILVCTAACLDMYAVYLDMCCSLSWYVLLPVLVLLDNLRFCMYNPNISNNYNIIGDWSNGMIGVSKTFGGSSILSSPAG